MQRSLAAFVTAAVLSLSGAAYADTAITESARAHFKAGVALLQDPSGARYEEAYREFKAAYADSPSPRMLGNVGLCAMKLERDGEAIQAYETYLAGVPDLAPDERRQVSTDVGTLKIGATHVTLTLNAPGAMISDTRTPVQGGSITNVYGPVKGTIELTLRPGNHVITTKLDGYGDARWEFEATAGGKVAHTFTLETQTSSAPSTGPAVPTTKTRPVPAATFVVGGITVGLIGGAVVTGILALQKNSDFKAANNGSNPANATTLRNSGETLNVLNDVFFAGAVVGAGFTTYLYVARPTVEVPAQTGFRASPSPFLSDVRLDVGGSAGSSSARIVGRF